MISKYVKKTLVLFVVVCMSISLVACSSSQTTKSDSYLAGFPKDVDDRLPANTVPCPETEFFATEPSETEHLHIFSESTKMSSCTEDGYTTFTCNCGYSYRDNYVESKHSYVEEVVAPTYTSQGYTKYVCKICGDSYIGQWQDKLPHSHKYLKTIVAPTCTDDGYTVYKCSICNYSYTGDEINSIGHNYLESTVAPSCIEDGYTLYKCAVCNVEYKSNIVKKTGHVFLSSEGADGGDIDIGGSNTFSEWENTDVRHHSRYCQNENCVYFEMELHDFTIPVVVEPTCTSQGYTEYRCICGRVGYKNNYTDALDPDVQISYENLNLPENKHNLYAYNQSNELPKNNAVGTPIHECNYKKTVVKPTCTTKGFTINECIICHDTFKNNVVNASKHHYNDNVYLPSCTESGYTIHECENCGDYYRDEKTDPLNHDYKTSTVVATTGWGGYDYHECILCGHSYKTNETSALLPHEFPKGYSDGTCKIVIYKEWYENAYVYAAHITFSDYSRLWMECANGRYNGGGEITSRAAKRVGAIFAVNGDFAIPANGAGGYAIARKGVVCNDKKTYPEGVYNSATGILQYGQSQGICGRQLSELVAEGLVTDTFQFGPAYLLDGNVYGDPNSPYRAQATFIGTNGNAGDIWICVSDGRYNDGKSAGLNGYQCATYLKSKGCVLGLPLDGGGSSTIYFNGEVLNAAKKGQRAVVDFLMFK